MIKHAAIVILTLTVFHSILNPRSSPLPKMPFNPQIRDERAHYAYQGNAAFGAGIAGGISQFGDAMGGMIQDNIAAADESAALRDSLLFAGDAGYANVTPEMLEKFDSGSLSAKRQMYATTMAMAEMDQKQMRAQQNMDYNLRTNQAASDYAAQKRMQSEQSAAMEAYQKKQSALDAMIRDSRRTGKISDAEAERVRSMPDPETGASLLDTIINTTGPVEIVPPDYQTYEVPGAGTIVRDEATGKTVPTSQIVRPPSNGGSRGSSRGSSAPIIDPAAAAQGLPTVVAPTAPIPQMDSQGVALPTAPNPLAVDFYFK